MFVKSVRKKDFSKITKSKLKFDVVVDLITQELTDILEVIVETLSKQKLI